MSNAKSPQRTDGIFGICAPTPLRGLWGIVVGVSANDKDLTAEIYRVQKMDKVDRKNMEDPDKWSSKGVWFDHCEHDNSHELQFRED